MNQPDQPKPNDAVDSQPDEAPSASPPPDSAEPSGAEWYYAVQDTQHGPIALEKLQELVRSGELMESDLVWRQGLADWRPASELGKLSAPDAFAHVEDRPASQPPRLLTREKLQRVTEVAGTGAKAGTRWLREHTEPRTWVFIGFTLILLARGCDTLGAKGVERYQAKSRLAQSIWEGDYDKHLAELNSKLKGLEDEGSRTAQEAVLKEIAELESEREKKRLKLKGGSWHELTQAADQAADRDAMWSYWRQWLKMTGLVVLTVSLGLVSIADKSPDRIVAMVMLAIVLYALLVT